MKIEEIIPLLREGKEFEICTYEYDEEKNSSIEKWVLLDINCNVLTLNILMMAKFREKEK